MFRSFVGRTIDFAEWEKLWQRSHIWDVLDFEAAFKSSMLHITIHIIYSEFTLHSYPLGRNYRTSLSSNHSCLLFVFFPFPLTTYHYLANNDEIIFIHSWAFREAYCTLLCDWPDHSTITRSPFSIGLQSCSAVWALFQKFFRNILHSYTFERFELRHILPVKICSDSLKTNAAEGGYLEIWNLRL